MRTHANYPIPIPPSAAADDWLSTTADGVPVRSLTWSTHDTPKVGISICGEQYGDDGHYTREIAIYGRVAAIDGLDAKDARELATALTAAADALEALG